jgi:YbbR domain-containing protein
MGWLVRNWHLKLGALGLATILYTGFVYSGSFTEQTLSGIRVDVAGLPADWIRLDQPRSVSITYRVAATTAELVQPQSFTATIDFAEYDPDLAAQQQSLRVTVRPAFDGIEILEVDPPEVTVTLDRVETKEVPVRVDRGEVPPGLDAGDPVLSVREVTARGAASLLRRVDRAQASVSIPASGVDVNDQFTLVAVDLNGTPVPAVELDPDAVTVQIEVEAIETTKTVPVRPALTGAPAAGYELGVISVNPPVVTLLGMPDVLSEISEVNLSPLSVAGATASLDLAGDYVVPPDTRLAEDSPDPSVTIEVLPSIATRTLLVGISCEGAPAGWACLPQQSQVAVTVRGPATVVAGLDPAALEPVVDVSGLGAGSHDIQLAFTLPDDVELSGSSPGTVTVVLVPPATPSPSPG